MSQLAFPMASRPKVTWEGGVFFQVTVHHRRKSGQELGDGYWKWRLERNTRNRLASILFSQFSYKTWDLLLRGGHHPWWVRPSHVNRQLRQFLRDMAMGQPGPVSASVKTLSSKATLGPARLTVKTKQHNYSAIFLWMASALLSGGGSWLVLHLT